MKQQCGRCLRIALGPGSGFPFVSLPCGRVVWWVSAWWSFPLPWAVVSLSLRFRLGSVASALSLSESWLFFLLWICRCYCRIQWHRPARKLLRFSWGLSLPVLSMVEFWLTSSLSFPGCSHPGLVVAPSPGFGFSGLVLGAGSHPVCPLHSLTPSHSGVCAVRVGVLLVSSLTAARLGLWPYGLAIAAFPLVSRPWTGLCWSHLLSLSFVSARLWCDRASWLAQGCVPLLRLFALLLAFWSRVPSGSLLRFSRQVFAMGSPFRVEPVSVLDRNKVSSSTFLVFGWSLRDGVTLSGRVCLRSRSEWRLFAHLP